MYDLMKPNSVEWLTDEEVIRARNQVHALREHWRPFGPQGVHSYTLGRATYLSPRFDQTIAEDVEFMHMHFGWLFDRTVEKIKEVFDIDNVRIFDEVTTPGFHVFTGPADAVEIPHYHVDTTIDHFIPDAPDDGWMHSFGALLDNISDPPAHLDYIYEGVHSSQVYEMGHMNLWNSYMKHKIGGVKSITNEEFRITFQGHVCKLDGEYVVYF
jgi:hypothetical protein